MVDVSIVIVCMNRPENLTPCLDSIREYTKVSYETFVVAYLFTPENLSWLRENYPWVTIVESHEIRGFSENNNLALRLAKGKYCFVVNDDTWMEMPVIDALVADFNTLPETAAVVSPAIVYPSGKRQTCGRGPWSARRYALHYLHMVDESRSTRWTWRTGLFPTYSLNGACFLIKMAAFRDVGWFDETYFFTPEDVALGMLLSQKGYGVYADSNIRIVHLAQVSTSSMETVIKPVRVRGSLILYSSLRHLNSPQGIAEMSQFTYFLLGAFVWTFESLRSIKYKFKRLRGGMTERDMIMETTARNVRRVVFSGLLPRDIFKLYMNELA